jgi:RNA polymerase sigma-70 factor, ECF subfamily
VKLWNQFDQVKDSGHEGQWMYTVVRNACYDLLRKNKKVYLSVNDLEAEIPDQSSSAEEQLSENQQRQKLLKTISQLTDVQREVLQLKFGENKSHQEISQLTGMSANHIGVFVFNLVKKLRLLSEQEGLNEIAKK